MQSKVVSDLSTFDEVWTDTMPLPLTELPLPIQPPSHFEQACMFVPLLGWGIAAGLEARRRRPRTDFIAKQIAERRHSTMGAWGDDPRRLAVASSVCDTIRVV